jgi:hypothetical protein
MALGYNIKIITGSGPAPTAWAGAIKDQMDRTRAQVCHKCNITRDEYDSLHYDLAYAWFEYHKYFEYTARVFIVSKIFHSWWKQQVAQEEQLFLIKYKEREMPSGSLLSALFEHIITMDIHPSAEIRRAMHEEGLRTLKEYPYLWRIKIYRNG